MLGVHKKAMHTLPKKMKLSIKNFFSKYDQISRKLRIWSHLLKKSVMENFIFCAMIFKQTCSMCDLLVDTRH